MIKKLLPKSEFSTQVLTLLSGSALAQALPIIISPILTRLYTPAEFGELALFIAFFSIGAVLATFRYELAIMLPKHDNAAVQIFTGIMGLIVLSSFIYFVFLFFLSPYFPQWFEAYKEDSKWIYLIPLAVVFAGLFQSLNYWLSRKKKFSIIAIGKVVQTGMNGAVSLGLGLWGANAIGLIAGALIGQISSAFFFTAKSFKSLITTKTFISKKRILSLLKRYSDFPKINTPHVLVETLQDQGIIFLITFFFSAPVLGFYAFALRILKTPVALIGASIYQVFYQKSSAMKAESKQLAPFIYKIYKFQFLVGFPLFTILFIFTPAIFDFVFGDEWRVAGEIAQILVPWLFLNFIASPVSSVAIVADKQKKAFYFSIVNIFIRVGAIMLGGYYDNYELGFILMSSLNSLVLLYALYWYYSIAKKIDSGIIKED